MGGVCCSEGLALLFFSEATDDEPQPPQKLLRVNSSLRRNMFWLMENYDISQELLGMGSFGIIRRATSKRTGAPCALKSLEKQCLPDSALHDLATEIRIQESCCHPNIVQIYESCEDVTHYHIAMEACEGGDLRDFTCEHYRLSEEHAGIVLQQVLDAVQYLHEVKHVAHRDLKLENLLLMFRHVPLEQNIVKLTDFGMASSFTPGEENLSLLCGTPEYLAPEVVHGRYNEKCDIWSCGIILYELLSGQLPFDAESPSETIWLARVSPLPLNCPGWDQVSDDAKALLRSMCRKDARSRPTARQALESLYFSLPEPAALPPPPASQSLVLETLDVDTVDAGPVCDAKDAGLGWSPVSTEAKTSSPSHDPDWSKTIEDNDTLSPTVSADITWEATSSSEESACLST